MVNEPAARRWQAFVTGLGSLIDLRGQATHEALRQQMPRPRAVRLRRTMFQTNALMNDELAKVVPVSADSP